MVKGEQLDYVKKTTLSQSHEPGQAVLEGADVGRAVRPENTGSVDANCRRWERMPPPQGLWRQSAHFAAKCLALLPEQIMYLTWWV